MKKKVLVTGGAGYIGAHTAVELINAGYEPVIIDNLSRSNLTLIEGIEKITGKKPNFRQGDCLNEKFLNEVFGMAGPFSCVLHFAAFKSVGESVQQPLMYFENNLGSIIRVLQTMRANNVTDIIFSSSCTVYGQPEHVPVNESAVFRHAESPYGATKQMSERILEDSHTMGLRVISLRYFNPIGAHPSSLMGELPIGTPNNLVPYITQTAAGKREKLTIFGNDYDTPDGTNIRDFIHVADVADAHVRAMEYLEKSSKSHIYEAFNLGTGKGVSVLELVNQFRNVTGMEVNYSIGKRRPGDVEKVYADPSKINEKMNWKTKYTSADALLHAWEWEKKISNP